MLAPLAHSAVAPALAGPRDRALASPLAASSLDPASRSQPAAIAAPGRLAAPLASTAIAAAPSSEGAELRAGGGDWLDLSGAAQRFLDQFRAGAGAGSVAGELLAGEVGRYLDAALEALSAEIEKVFQLLGMSAKDAAAAAAGLSAPLASQANAAMTSFHMDSAAIAATSEVTATGSRQSLSLVMQSIDIAVDSRTGTVSVTQRSLSVAVELRTGDMVQSDPLILDLAGNGIALAAVGDRLFDLDGDGRIDRPAWVAGDDALLVLDRNGNGGIDDGRELFGDQNGAADGFAELARFDANGDGNVDAADPVFEKLRLLFADGRQDSLADHGIVRLRLGAVVPLGIDIEGGRLVAGGRFDRADGGGGQIVEALLDMTA